MFSRLSESAKEPDLTPWIRFTTRSSGVSRKQTHSEGKSIVQIGLFLSLFHLTDMKISSFSFLLALVAFGLFSTAVDVDADLEQSFQNQCQSCSDSEKTGEGAQERHSNINRRDAFESEPRFCKRQSGLGLTRRADGDDGDGNGGIGVGVNVRMIRLAFTELKEA